MRTRNAKVSPVAEGCPINIPFPQLVAMGNNKIWTKTDKHPEIQTKLYY